MLYTIFGGTLAFFFYFGSTEIVICNYTRTQSHLVCKRTLKLAKWLSIRLRTKWLWVRVQLQIVKLQISRLVRARSSLTFRQLESEESLWKPYVTWEEHTVRNCDVTHYLQSCLLGIWWNLIIDTFLFLAIFARLLSFFDQFLFYSYPFSFFWCNIHRLFSYGTDCDRLTGCSFSSVKCVVESLLFYVYSEMTLLD